MIERKKCLGVITKYDKPILWASAIILVLSVCWAIRVPLPEPAYPTLAEYRAGRP